MTYNLLKGNNLELLPTLADNSIDAIVTDPPYGLGNPDPDYIIKAIQLWASGDRSHIPEGRGFMGKSWDAFVPPPAVWDECFRVLKPGGHLLAFAGTRTYDLMGISIRMAGFEIRDSIGWVYGSGFPKSLDVAKAIDQQAGAQREVIGQKSAGIGSGDSYGKIVGERKKIETNLVDITAPATPEAQQWQGWGTALKPALEPIVVARKPLIGTVAENVLTYGTGGLNIDGSRIGTENITINTFDNGAKPWGEASGEPYTSKSSVGRWPANVIFDEDTAGLLDEQSGISTSPSTPVKQGGKEFGMGGEAGRLRTGFGTGFGDSGGASRFFYVAKASKRDRNEGLEGLDKHVRAGLERSASNSETLDPVSERFRTNPVQNFHPTVKPTDLMRYLIKLITPPGGTVLDPFTGSGSTGKAAILEGFDFIGVELTEDYWPIIEGRLKHAEAQVAEEKEKAILEETEKLF
jgi:site-specific DNA-methyltransferase (adenine-specific)